MCDAKLKQGPDLHQAQNTMREEPTCQSNQMRIPKNYGCMGEVKSLFPEAKISFIFRGESDKPPGIKVNIPAALQIESFSFRRY